MGELKKYKPENDFGRVYEILCSRKRVSPLAVVQARLSENRLKFCCDRVVLDDWSPILNGIAADRRLVEIQIYSRYRRKIVDETIDTQEKLDAYRTLRSTSCRVPIIYTNYLLRCFVDAVAVCARSSTILTTLRLDGIPLADGGYLKILCSGLANNRNLQNLSLARCAIGDEGCNIVLGSLLDCHSLRVIDFTNCSLTSKIANFLSLFLTKKRINLLNEATDSNKTETNHQGLRSLILDENRKFRDDGLRLLARTLKDDFWLKKLSLRNCGLTKISGDAVMDLLETNSIIEVVNLKNNRIPMDVLRSVRRLLKRRRKKGKTMSLKKRFLSRKKDLKRRNGPASRMDRRKAERDDEERKSSRKLKFQKKMNSIKCEPNLTQLNERLSNVINRNRNLTSNLANDRRLLVSEKLSRLTAERSYRLMRPVFERLVRGAQKQRGISDKIFIETELCENVRKIFHRLERICEKNAKARDEPHDKAVETASEVAIVDDSTINRWDDERKIVRNVQKRPHCPSRHKTRNNSEN